MALALLSACSASEGNDAATGIEGQAKGETEEEQPPTEVRPSPPTTIRRPGGGDGGPVTSTLGKTLDANDLEAIRIPGDDPLRRRDAPPSGARGSLTFLANTGGPCDEGQAPELGSTSETYPTGGVAYLYVCGFDPTSPVSVAITPPDGQTSFHAVISKQTREGLEGELNLGIAPDGPTGFYRVTATQGTTELQDGFTVVPKGPRIGVANPREGSPGTTFRFEVVSPFPYEPAVLDLYGPDGIYLTTLASITTDGEGRVPYEIRTHSDSPAGKYCVVVRPAAGNCAEFEVR